METSSYVASLRLDGGHLALDFVNTLGGSDVPGPQPHDEHLRGYVDLVAWSVRAGALEAPAAERLAAAAEADPAWAEQVLGDALAQREGAYAALRPLAEGRRPPPEALRAVEEEARRALAHGRLEPSHGSYRWRWHGDDLRLPLWPPAHATAGLLTEGPLERLKVCRGCRWLFLDASKNRSRRWCSMEECGTSAKKRRYVERRRSRAGTGAA